MKNGILILSILTTTMWEILAQQPGELDVTFDADGMVTTSIGIGNDFAYAVAIQPDGKIVIAGSAYDGNGDDFALARYNTNGTLDNTFTSDGLLTTDFGTSEDIAHSVAIQPDGKIVAAGITGDVSRDFAIVRYNADGTLDNGFGTNGKVTTDYNSNDNGIYSISIQPNGKIVAVGFANNGSDGDFFLVRYNTDGTLDNGFGIGGKLITDIGENDYTHSVIIQPDGKIVVAGGSGNAPNADFALARYNEDGTLDNSFGTGGKITTDFNNNSDGASSLVIQSDGKIVAVGFANNNDFALARYNTDGTLDNSFSSDGKLTTDFDTYIDGALSAAIQPDGKIVTAGISFLSSAANMAFALARYNSDGTLDNSFSSDGKLVTDFGIGDDSGESLAIAPDGKIVVGGYSVSTFAAFAIARYISGLNVGILEFSAADNFLIYPNPVQSIEVLEYVLNQDESLSIELYDNGGRLIRTFVTNETRSKGIHVESLNFGDTLISGNYILTITNGLERTSIKVTKQ